MKLDALVHWYSALTPEIIPLLSEIYHEDASFRDPFNKVRGQPAMTAGWSIVTTGMRWTCWWKFLCSVPSCVSSEEN